jgi:hypothetical protein
MGTPIRHLERGHGHGHGSRLSNAPEIDPAAQPRFHVSIDGPMLDKLTMPFVPYTLPPGVNVNSDVLSIAASLEYILAAPCE